MEFTMQQKTNAPKKSLVLIRFPQKGIALNYYNDRFDLKVGDQVYVEGKMAGQIGRVEELNYHFKIKLSDYWRVIAERGHKYYLKNRVRYICLDCGVGYSQYKIPQNRC